MSSRRTPEDRYVRTMESLAFSPDQLAEIERGVAQALRAEPAVLAEQAAETLPACPRRHGARRARPQKRLVAALAAAAMALSLGGLAFAAGGGMVSIPALFEAVFRIPAEQVEPDTPLATTSPIPDEPLASATDNGVTITLDAIISDSSSCVLVFSASYDGEVAPWHDANAQGTAAPVHFESHDAIIPVERASGRITFFSGGIGTFDTEPYDGNLHFYFDIQTRDVDMAGQTLHVTFTDILSWSNREVLCPGTWEFEIEANPTMDSRTVEIEQSMPVLDTEVHFSSVSVSPIGISLSYSFERSIDLEIGFPGKEDRVSASSVLVFAPLSVTLADGTVVHRPSPTSGGSQTMTEHNYFEGQLVARFDELVNPADVVAVTIGDTIVPLVEGSA